MTYSLFILPAAEKDCNRLSQELYSRCHKAFLKLVQNPRPMGCQKLHGEDGYRLRVGDYRILYRIDDSSKKIYG
jgi:mRNA interferase RelE/StbE